MIYLFVTYLRDQHDVDLGPLRLFTFIEFRTVMAMILGFALVLISGKPTIRWLIRQKVGDQPEFDHKDLNELMRLKANTPTMGGIMIVAAIFITTLLLADISPQGGYYVLMALVGALCLFAVGLADDWLKLTAKRRSPTARQGLYTWEKLLFQIGLAVVLGIFVHWYAGAKFTVAPEEYRIMSQSFTLPFIKSWDFVDGQWAPADHLLILPRWAFVMLAVMVIVGSSNAVNLTDGMDGLAGGVMVIVAFAFMILCIIAGYENPKTGFNLAQFLLVPHIPFSDELAIIAAAMVGSCVGFLWFNCSPAQVFMGDSGSLTLGGLIGFIAVVIRQEVLLFIIGGIFVLEAVSVIMQVGYFKMTGGKRIFRCAPIHHHFHLSGWTEQQVVVRFWLISIMLAAIALMTIKLR